VYELIEAPPVPWEPAWPAMFRLPGFGGAAVFLRTVIAEAEDSPVPDLRVDLGLLDPGNYRQFLRRPVGAGLPSRLSAFFMAAAGDWNPESSLTPLQDDELGLSITVTESDEHRVTLLVEVQDDPEPVGLDFQTSRAALAQAARDVRVLDHADGVQGGEAEPPQEWE